MMRGWLTVILLGLLTFAIKAAGPALLGARPVPNAVLQVLRLAAPALFAALVALQVFTAGSELVVDARLAGLVVAVVGAVRRASPLLVIAGAVVATAALRLLFH